MRFVRIRRDWADVCLPGLPVSWLPGFPDFLIHRFPGFLTYLFPCLLPSFNLCGSVSLCETRFLSFFICENLLFLPFQRSLFCFFYPWQLCALAWDAVFKQQKTTYRAGKWLQRRGESSSIPTPALSGSGAGVGDESVTLSAEFLSAPPNDSIVDIIRPGVENVNSLKI